MCHEHYGEFSTTGIREFKTSTSKANFSGIFSWCTQLKNVASCWSQTESPDVCLIR